MRNKIMMLAIAVLVFVAGGCSASFATLDDSGLKYSRNNIVVEGDPGTVFGSQDWKIDNWIRNFESLKWRMKTSGEYEGYITIDLNDDEIEEIVKENYTELELSHSKTDALIVLDISPLAFHDKDKKMEVLLSYFVESMSGSVSWRERSRHVGTKVIQKTYATKLVDFKLLNKGEIEIICAQVEVADLNQLRLDPNHRSATISVILAKIPDFKLMPLGTMIEETTSAVMTVFLSSNPKDFEGLLDDMHTFVSLISVNGEHLGIERTVFDFKDKTPILEEEKPITGEERKEDAEKTP